jgi:hypothetical protein
MGRCDFRIAQTLLIDHIVYSLLLQRIRLATRKPRGTAGRSRGNC